MAVSSRNNSWLRGEFIFYLPGVYCSSSSWGASNFLGGGERTKFYIIVFHLMQCFQDIWFLVIGYLISLCLILFSTTHIKRSCKNLSPDALILSSSHLFNIFALFALLSLSQNTYISLHPKSFLSSPFSHLSWEPWSKFVSLHRSQWMCICICEGEALFLSSSPPRIKKGREIHLCSSSPISFKCRHQLFFLLVNISPPPLQPGEKSKL